MKLPLDDSVVPDGGHDPSAEETSSRGGGGGGGGGVEVQANGQAAAANGSSSGTSGPGEPDFSEYLWMEHEEDFDNEVLRELEDEEMLQYYCDLYEEEQAKANNTSSSSNNSHPNSSSHPHHRQAPSSHETPNCSIRIPGPTPPYSRATPRSNYQNDGLGEITRGLDRVSFSSRLNPNAAEFVPRGVDRSPAQDSHHLT